MAIGLAPAAALPAPVRWRTFSPRALGSVAIGSTFRVPPYEAVAIDNLVVSLEADTSAFEAALNGALSKVNNLRNLAGVLDLDWLGDDAMAAHAYWGA